jgi:hypothetical protein
MIPQVIEAATLVFHLTNAVSFYDISHLCICTRMALEKPILRNDGHISFGMACLGWHFGIGLQFLFCASGRPLFLRHCMQHKTPLEHAAIWVHCVGFLLSCFGTLVPIHCCTAYLLARPVERVCLFVLCMLSCRRG